MINDEIRNALNEENLEKEDLNRMVYTSDVITLLQDGLMKVLDGSTSFDEIYKIIDVDDDLDVYCKIRGIEYNDEKKEEISKDVDVEENKKSDMQIPHSKEEMIPKVITIDDKKTEEEDIL